MNFYSFLCRYGHIAEDESLNDHDRKYHPKGFNPETDTCEYRERMAKSDKVDELGNLKQCGISGVFTGSHADYNRASLTHVGEANGALSHGWGIYGSNKIDVANIYAYKLDPKEKSVIYEQTFFTDRDCGDDSHLLIWNEPISKENRERIAKGFALKFAHDEKYQKGLYDSMNRTLEGMTGEQVYEFLYKAFYTKEKTSKWLAGIGVDGVKYPADSRNDSDGNKVGWNYVSFRDDNIRTTKKFIEGKEVPVKDSMKVSGRIQTL